MKIYLVAAIAILAAGAAYFFCTRSPSPSALTAAPTAVKPAPSEAQPQALDVPAAGAMEKSPAKVADAAVQEADASVTPNDPVGRVQPVAEHTNAQVDSVIEAERTGGHPERLSALIAPQPFNREAFLRDPKAYLEVVEPARVFQSASPAPDVPVLQRLGPTAFQMRQDGEIILRVRTQASYPVTFTSFDLGHFENQLATQTVQSDEHGGASVRFFAGPGTINAVHILAGSPGASGQVQFRVDVQPSVAAAEASTATPSVR